jgi:putative endonuclease
MKTYYVYILKCSDDSYYAGVTNNLDRRVAEHSEGIDNKSYTFKRRPIQLVFCDAFNDINKAIAFEKQIIGWSKKKKEALIERNWDKLKELASCKNQISHKNLKTK